MKNAASIIFLALVICLSSCTDVVKSKAELELDIARDFYKSKDLISSLSVLEGLLVENETLSPEVLSRAYYLKGYILYKMKGDESEIIKSYFKAIENFKLLDDDKALSVVYNHYAEVFYNHFTFDVAYDYYKIANEYAGKIDYLMQEAATNYGMGKSQRKMGNFEVSLNHLSKTLFYARKYDDYQYWAASKIEIGNMYYDLGNYAYAQAEFNDVLKLIEDKPKLINYFATAHKNIGYCLFDNGQYEEAQGHFLTSLTVPGRDSVRLAGTYLKLGQIAVKLSAPTEGLAYYKKSLAHNVSYLDMEEFKLVGDELISYFDSRGQVDSVDHYKIVLFDIQTPYFTRWNQARYLDQKTALRMKSQHALLEKEAADKEYTASLWRVAGLSAVLALLVCGMAYPCLLWIRIKKKSKSGVRLSNANENQFMISLLETENKNLKRLLGLE